MKPVRSTRTTVVMHAAALEAFLDEFLPRVAIPALVKLCELARTHPDFDKHGA